MRIIGGEAKGRRLYTPGRSSVRPTNDRIKEAFFNIVRDMDGKTFLDLFAGTGNMGLEALSRGAIKAVFVDQNPVIIDIMSKNIALCRYADQSEVLAADSFRAIEKLIERRDAFDIVFADPPYEQGFVIKTLTYLESGLLMADGGLLAVQHSIRENAENCETGRLNLIDRRQYGDTILSFFRKSSIRSKIFLEHDKRFDSS